MATPKKEEVRRNVKKLPKPSFGNNHLMLEVGVPTKGESHWQNQPHHILTVSINYNHSRFFPLSSSSLTSGVYAVLLFSKMILVP
jgi:hypothetical protein